MTLLPALYEKQRIGLREQGLESAAREAFAKIAAASWQERTFDRHGYSKIKGYYALDASKKSCLKNFYIWRFEQAKEANCAVFMFLPDEKLAELVQKKDNLQDILSPEKYRRYRSEIEKILQLEAGTPIDLNIAEVRLAANSIKENPRRTVKNVRRGFFKII